MIVDVHAHCWPSLESFSASFLAEARRMRTAPVNLVARYEHYQGATAGEEVVTIVFGGKARLSGLWLDDADVAAYVARDPRRMIIHRDTLALLGLPDPRGGRAEKSAGPQNTP